MERFWTIKTTVYTKSMPSANRGEKEDRSADQVEAEKAAIAHGKPSSSDSATYITTLNPDDVLYVSYFHCVFLSICTCSSPVDLLQRTLHLHHLPS